MRHARPGRKMPFFFTNEPWMRFRFLKSRTVIGERSKRRGKKSAKMRNKEGAAFETCDHFLAQIWSKKSEKKIIFLQKNQVFSKKVVFWGAFPTRFLGSFPIPFFAPFSTPFRSPFSTPCFDPFRVPFLVTFLTLFWTPFLGPFLALFLALFCTLFDHFFFIFFPLFFIFVHFLGPFLRGQKWAHFGVHFRP